VDPVLLQLGDATFPCGGFAHSGGVEAARNAGLVRDEVDLAALVRQIALQAANLGLPFALAVREDPGAFVHLDAELDDLLRANHVARRASAEQGRGLLAAAAAAFPDTDLGSWKRRARTDGLPTHLAMVQGLCAQRLALGPDETGRWLLHCVVRDALTAAVRLNLVGPLRAQALHARLAGDFAELLDWHARLRPEDASGVCPLLDLVQADHASAWTRLFRS